MESHLPINQLQANLQDLTQAATNLQADLATPRGQPLSPNIPRVQSVHHTLKIWGHHD